MGCARVAPGTGHKSSCGWYRFVGVAVGKMQLMLGEMECAAATR